MYRKFSGKNIKEYIPTHQIYIHGGIIKNLAELWQIIRCTRCNYEQSYWNIPHL